MKSRVVITEPMELAILDRLQAGETIAKIARELDVWRMQVWRIKQAGRPRWRHRAHGNLEPSPAVIAWHCNSFKANWTAEEEWQRRVEKPTKYGVLEVSLADAGLAVQESHLSLLMEGFKMVGVEDLCIRSKKRDE